MRTFVQQASTGFFWLAIMSPNNDDHRGLFVDQPAFQPRRLKIICIGAGFSGLTLAYKVQHDPRNSHFDLTIYEKNTDVGGTWLENVYPGVACDVCLAPGFQSRHIF